jgi:hypothetical protein
VGHPDCLGAGGGQDSQALRSRRVRRGGFKHFPLDYATIENVQSTPNDGHVGAFTFGKVTGIAIGIFAGLDIPLASVAPAKWKMQMRVPADKKASKNRASELFPNCTAGWSREMDHGRSEAAIIALYTAITSASPRASPSPSA